MRLEEVPATITVASGKGGVGKTTVASDLARAAHAEGHTVGLIDGDISTPNSPEVLGGEANDLSDQRLASHDAIIPPEVNGIQLVSQGVVLPDDVPVLRDGTWRAEAVADYIANVEWDDDTDVVFIDTPPGTGEELQTIAAAAQPDYGFIVTTPHPSAVRDATKTHEFYKQASIGHGVVLNMAYIPAEDLVAHLFDSADVKQVDGIGDAKEGELRSLFEGNVADFDMFDHENGDGVEIDAPLVATVPYTTDFGERQENYGKAMEAVEEALAKRGVET